MPWLVVILSITIALLANRKAIFCVTEEKEGENMKRERGIEREAEEEGRRLFVYPYIKLCV